MNQQHKAETRITGDVVEPIRCHPYAGGTVANFGVEVTYRGHTEEYKCVAFKDLGADIERSIAPGQVVSVVGHMQTKPWKDEPAKMNHQLIASEFSIESTVEPAQKQSVPPRKSKPTRQRRQYGRHARKPKQEAIDFRSVVGEPEFNDRLPF